MRTFNFAGLLTWAALGSAAALLERSPVLLAADAPAKGGLVSRWSGEGNSFDFDGRNDGKLRGNVLFAPAQVGLGFRFSHDGDGVSVRHDRELNVRSRGFSADFWMRADADPSEAIATIVEKSAGWTDATGWAFQVSASTGFPTFTIGDGTAFPEVTGSVDVLDGAYHHIAGTWDRGRISLYVDGVEQQADAATSFNPSPATNSRDVNIGFSWGGGVPSRFFRGTVDEVEVFSRALSPGQVTEIVAADSAPGFTRSGSPASDAPTVARAALSTEDCVKASSAPDRTSGPGVQRPADRADDKNRPSGRNTDDGHGHHVAGPSRESHEEWGGVSCRPAGRRGHELDGRCEQKSRGHGSSSGISKADFNGDGFADLAIGVVGEETPVGVPGSGAVIVIYGSENGLTATDSSVPASQFWSQNSPNVPGVSEAFDKFGSALAGGDFNDDGFSDLAIGVEREDVTVPGPFGIGTTSVSAAGGFVVIYGTSSGLSTTSASVPSPKFFTLNSSGAVPDKLRSNSFVGSSMAWGDFDGDGVGDLAIGAPGFDGGRGAVWVVYGKLGDGLTMEGDQFLSETFGQAGSRLGTSLAAGDFDRDGATDLAIGAPFFDVPFIADDSGLVKIRFGSRTDGLQGARTKVLFAFEEINAQASYHAEAQLGFALAAGDFDADGFPDLAVGAPGDAVTFLNQQPVLGDNAGAVWIFSAVGKDGVASEQVDQIIRQSTVHSARPEFSSVSETNDRFGFAVAVGNFNADGFADLAVGVPGETTSGALSAGEVDVLYGSERVEDTRGGLLGFTVTPRRFDRGTLGGVITAGDQFGASLSAWDFGRAESLASPTPPFRPVLVKSTDLAIGTPSQAVGGKPGCGAIHVLYGSRVRGGLSTSAAQVWSQDSSGIPGGSEAGDAFGFAIY